MILKTQIQQILDDFTTNRLADYPSHRRYLTHPSRYRKFVELLHIRLNELDLAGYVRSPFAIKVFVLRAFALYAQKQLEKAGMKTPDVPMPGVPSGI